jgi:hypothetical protein
MTVVQGKPPAEVHALVVSRLGPPTRTIGSGLQIEQWDVDGGVLTFHPLTGPTFDKGGRRTWLMRTSNPAAECLLGRYEMVTLAEAPHGTGYWLGNVSLTADGQYTYTDSEQNREHRAGQRSNFFLLHPKGSFEVIYLSGVTPETRLEEVPDGTAIATVRFVAQDRRSGTAHRIVASPTRRLLAFEGKAMSFRMYKGWVNYWR